jgi:hypothetical protein
LLGRGVTRPSEKIDAEQFHRYFDEKVAGVRSTTADAPLPSFEKSSTDVAFNCFQTVSSDDVVAAVKALPDKSCTLDPLPTKLLKAAVDVISPFLTELFNRSLSQGHVPDSFKIAHISPRLKKADLGSSDVRSYRPIYNLSIISKLLERLVAHQLKAHHDSCGLFPRLQSAYIKS